MTAAERPAVPPVARAIAAHFATRPAVRAVALAGSRGTEMAGADADLDLYVYADAPISLAERAALAERLGVPGWREIGNDFWGPGDEWSADTPDGPRGIDLMFFAPDWMADQLDRVLVRHEPSLGYSTAFWHTIRHSLPLFDRDGWFARLRATAAAPYPEPLRRAIVAHNHPTLRAIHSSLLHQLAIGVERGDLVGAQGRLTAILAGYFDILFATNRQTHPGEKRLVAHALARCARLPADFPADLERVLAAPLGPATIALVGALLDGLDALLADEGLLPPGGEKR